MDTTKYRIKERPTNQVQHFVMPEDAFALRPVRFVKDGLRIYAGTTFPRNPRAGCDLYYRRCKAFGHIPRTKTDAAGICDVLNKGGDIIADFPLTKKGLNYLYRVLDLRVEA